MSDGDAHNPPLTGALAVIEEIAGREAALALAQHMGGTTLHMPGEGRLGPKHPLVLAVGVDAARIISGHFRGESLYIPKDRPALVLHLYAQGMSTKRIAACLGITERAVRQNRARRPGNMFP